MLTRLRNWLLRLLEYPPSQATRDYAENCRNIDIFLNPDPPPRTERHD